MKEIVQARAMAVGGRDIIVGFPIDIFNVNIL
jgi:hypothetical protein